jgi:hypothetical protein
MAKFHINPETGKPGVCTASARPCLYGEDTPHFNTPDEARTVYEQAMSDVGIPTLSRPRRNVGLPELPKTDIERISEVKEMTNKAYVFAGKLESDAKANRGKHARNPQDLRLIANEIDAIVDDCDFETVEGSERSLERLVEYKTELSRKADHFDAEGDSSKSYTYWYASERLADLIVENVPEAA